MPAYPVNPPVPPHPSNNFQRSWSDEHIPVNNHQSREPIRSAPRSSSFSASRAPQPQWRNDPPPPPVPPLPPALLPGFHRPPLAHTNLDFAFTEAPRRPPPPVPQPRPGPSYSGPDYFQGHASPPPRLLTNPAPAWPPVDHRNNPSSPNSGFGSPQPAVPGAATSYVPDTTSLGNRRPSYSALAQHSRNYEQSYSPPPAVPPRPTTVHGEVRFERAPPIPLQENPLPPPIPPKTLTSPISPITSSPLFPNIDDTLTSLSQGSIAPASYDAQSITEAQEITQPNVPETHLPTVTEAEVSEVPGTRQPEVSEATSSVVPEAALPEVPNVGPHDVSDVGPFEFSEAGLSKLPEKGVFPFPSVIQANEAPLLDSDLKRAMTLSLADSQRKSPVKKAQEEEEDDELARALAESLSLSTNLEQYSTYSRVEPSSSTKVESSVGPETSRIRARESNEASEISLRRRPSVPASDILSPEELEDHAAHEQIMLELEDEEVTRRLQEEEERKMATELRERERRAEERARLDVALTRQLQEEEARTLEAERLERERQDEERARQDAELVRREKNKEKARKLMQEAQERKDAEMARSMAETNEPRRPRASRGAGSAPSGQSPPQYMDVVGSPPAPRGYTRPTTRPVQSSPQSYNGVAQQGRRVASAYASEPERRPEQGDFTRSATVNGGISGRRSDSNSGLHPEGLPLQSQDPSPGSSNSGSSSRVNPVAGASVAGPRAGPSRVGPGAVSNPSRSRPTPSAAPSPGSSAAPSPGSSAAPSAAPSAASEGDAIGSNVLKGVSYGFKPPDPRSPPAQSGVSPICPPFPEVISLFRAPSPPFHIMANSWRHLMRLLAQLETRLQANLEVIANSKEENLLRVVVQFVKLPYTANTWRTIVHLSLDQPVPRNTQNSWRFTNGDTTTLPYSYTLAPPLPYFVNNPNSQFYVIPLSATSPFPILPITLPNLALYLQSAMRDSRAKKVQNDPSNGMRRLARMVAAYYPEETIVPDKEERKPTRGVGMMIRRVMGRGGGQEASQENEDVYDIITPFRIDQYTAS